MLRGTKIDIGSYTLDNKVREKSKVNIRHHTSQLTYELANYT